MVDDAEDTRTLTARWVFPVETEPLPGGTITVRGGRILAVEPHGARRADVDLGNAAILPGLVNAHTHLDLTGLRGRCPPSRDFTAWLREVIRHRRGVTPEQVEADIRAGLAESLRCGSTLLGDISAGGVSWPVLAAAPIRAVVFRELLGLPQDRAALALDSARAWLESHPATATCRPGLSPHAPYSTRLSLITRAALLARTVKAPLAVHLAETQAELELLHQRRGDFVTFLKELGVWDPDGLAGGAKEVMQAAAACYQRVPKLFIHGNYLAPSARVPRGSTIVYCPRTHAAFGHAPHPFRQFLERGIRVALGTDSLASNPDLSVLEEARFLHRHCPDVPPGQLLHMATLAGAEALGWADDTGSLRPGKSADLVVLPLPDRGPADPYELVLASQLPVHSVLCRGRRVAGPETAH